MLIGDAIRLISAMLTCRLGNHGSIKQMNQRQKNFFQNHFPSLIFLITLLYTVPRLKEWSTGLLVQSANGLPTHESVDKLVKLLGYQLIY